MSYSNWNITVENPNNVFGDHISLFVVDGKIAETCEALSKQYTNCRVSLCNFARVRGAWKNGVMIQDNQSLSEFYIGISDEQERAWKKFFRLPDDTRIEDMDTPTTAKEECFRHNFEENK